MTKNIDDIVLWCDNPDKTRISQVVRINFCFPCTWTILSLADLEKIIKLWIIGEEKKYPLSQGFNGRWMLYDQIKEWFKEKNCNGGGNYGIRLE